MTKVINFYDSNEAGTVMVPFAPPPLCAFDPRTIVKEKDSVIVVNNDGERINGSIHKDGIFREYLLLDTETSSEPYKVQYDEVKMISLPDFKQWIELPLPKNGESILDEQVAVDFKVRFADGDDFKGKTLGFNTDKNGLYLFPSQKPGYFIYIFIPHHAIVNYQIGPKIGEQLIENNIVNQKEVDVALLEQEEKRDQLLGEYLKSHALVTNQALEEALNNQKEVPNIKLGDILIKEKIITEEQLDLAMQEQLKNKDLLLGDILIEQGMLSPTQLQQSLANKLGIPFVDITKLIIDQSIMMKIPEKVAKQYNVMPLEFFNGKIVIAMEAPLNWKVLEAIRFVASCEIIPVMAFAEEIRNAIKVNYTLESDENYDEVVDNLEEEFIDDKNTSNNFIVRLVNKIIIDAHEQNISDIHIESNSGRKKTNVRFRKDGSLFTYHAISPKLRRAIVSRLKIMANLDISERRRPQDGKINFGRYSRLKIELRIVSLPTIGGEEDVVIRILASGKPISLDEMQLSADNRECIKYVLGHPHGLFIVCGPTGSGKTTLLHSMLQYINKSDTKIWTVEDPVEITQEGLRQVQVETDHIDFNTALRSFLRADPDVIMVGEMRDTETTNMCIEASLTGHKVLSTLHTNSASECIVRLLEMGMDPFNFSDALLGIVSQRLVKRLCSDCKQEKKLSTSDCNALLEEYIFQFEQAGITGDLKKRSEEIMNHWKEEYTDQHGQFTVYEAKGCKLCDDTGYHGRIGIQEMLMISEPIRVAIYRQAKAKEILKISMLEGMTTLKQDGIYKIFQGITDIKQIRKAS